LQESIGARVAAAAKRALAAPYPAAEALLGHVYAGTKA
jgi:TPP-dependent pyruvate/acetoin dehydrogenase alpha subunit